MMPREAGELYVLVLAPVGQDARLVCELLEKHDIPAIHCRTPDQLVEMINDGAGVVLLTEEAADDVAVAQLAEAIGRQSPWLDLPVLLCATPSRAGVWPPHLQRLQRIGNATLLERPLRIGALISAVRSGLRTQRRQRRLELIVAMTNSLVAENEPDRLLADVWRTLDRHLPVTGFLHHVHVDAARLRLAAVRGIADEAVAELVDLAAVDVVQLIEGGPLRAKLEAASHGTVESFPLTAGGERYGLLSFLLAGPRPLPPDERAFLRLVCDHVALALRRSQTLREVQYQADQLLDNAHRKDEFLAMLGHELRNPLATLAMALELIRDEQPSDSTAGPREIALQQTKHITHLVDDLLDVSRITRGIIELQFATIDVNAIVAEAIQGARTHVDSRGHSLEVKLAPDVMWVRGDRTRLRQVVENLVTNAAKYTDVGGRIVVTTAKQNESVEIAVRDNGIGLSAEMLSRVFDLFVQDRRALDRSQGGLGIGLTLVQRLVQLHGGEVDVRSDGQGHGSHFRVRLPLAAASDMADTANDTGQGDVPAKTEPLRVLIAEDVKPLGEMTRRLIERMGHQAELTFTGGEAIEACQRIQPDLVLLDIGLPDLDGYEVVGRIRRNTSDAAPLLVALTGYGQAEDRQRALAAGFDRHIAKPVSVDALRRLLSDAAQKGARDLFSTDV